MNNFQQNQRWDYVNVTSDKGNLNIFSLGLSLVILLSVAPYWIGMKENSALFLINRRLELYIDTNSVSMFFLHLIITLIGLLIYFKSGGSKSLADNISYTNYVIELFDEENKTKTKKIQLFIKIILISVIIICFYMVFIDILKGIELPIIASSTIFISLVLVHLVWNIEEKEDNEHKRISKFNIERFNKKVSNIPIFGNIDGQIEGELIVNPDFTSKAIYMKSKSRNPKITAIIDESKLKAFVNNALSKCNIDEEVEQRRNFLEEFKFKSSNKLDSKKLSEEIILTREKTSSTSLTKEINKKIQEEIESKIGEHPFRIKFSITKDTIKDTLLKEIDRVVLNLKGRTEAEEAYQEKIRLENRALEERIRVQTEERRKSLLNTLDQLVINSHTQIDKDKYFRLRFKIDTFKIIDEQTFVEISSELNHNPQRQQSFFQPNIKPQQKQESYYDTEATVIGEEFSKPADSITKVLYEYRGNNIDDNTKGKLSGSTSIFEDYEIDINNFLNIVNEKWANEQGERNKNAYKQLIWETLFQLSGKK